MEKTDRLLHQNILKVFLGYLLPTVMGMITHSLYCLADVMFIGVYVGSTALAAMNICMPIFTLFTSIGLLIGVGASTTIMVKLGQGDHESPDKIFSLAILCNLVVGVTISVLATLYLEPFARFLGATDQLMPYVSQYMTPINCTCFAFILSSMMQVIIRADYNPKLVMIATVTGNLFNIVFDYVFMAKMGMGIFGAALATGIAPVVGLCVSSLHILTRRSRFRLRPFRPALRPLADLAGLGSAAFLNECSSGLVLVVFNLLTLRLAGTLGVAAYGIVANLALMALALFTGVNQGVQPLVSLAHGRGDAAGVRTLCRMALGLALCAGLCMAALAFFAAGPLVSLFNRDGDPALQQMAEQGLRLYFLGFPFAGLNLVTASFLGAAEHPSRSLRLSLLRGFVAIVAAALLLAALLGLTGVWLAFPAAEGAVLLVSLRLSRSLRRARPEPAPQAITTALR